MKKKLAQRARIGLAVALFVLSAGNGAVFAADDTQATNACETFIKKISALTESDFSKDEDMHPRHIERELKQCGTRDSKIALVLEQIFRYRPAMGNRDFPNPQEHSPGTDIAALREHEIREMNDALQKLKTMDKDEVERVLGFMATQPVNSYEFAWPAFEMAARLYPKEYASFESLTQPGTEGRRAWEFEKKRWITGEER
jgi:hypothetical protein